MVSENEKEAWIAKLDKRIVEVNRYMPSKEDVDIRDVNAFTLEYPLFSVLQGRELEFIIEAKNIMEFKKDGKFSFLFNF
jgi:hypothetical protein